MRFVLPVASVDKGKGLHYVDSQHKILSILMRSIQGHNNISTKKVIIPQPWYRATETRPSVSTKAIQFIVLTITRLRYMLILRRT